jgi:hypothetical protein
MTRLIPIIGLLAGCAHQAAALHTETSTSAIAAAEAVGAQDVPKAALHLQYAKEEEDAAKKLNDEHKEEQATSLLLRAQADAELALALSNQESERAEAKAALERLQSLQK